MCARSKQNATGDGRFAYEGLDRAIHEKARLGILTSLVAHPEGLLFNDLKELCSLTDGNLNRHLAVLEEERLVAANRNAKRGRPQTVVSMTPAGRKRFQQYLNVLERFGPPRRPARRKRLRIGRRSRPGFLPLRTSYLSVLDLFVAIYFAIQS
jgi:DNA-binding MarR family transcriptional regulator